MNTSNLFLITAQPEFAATAIQELQQLQPQLEDREEVAPGLHLCATPDPSQFIHLLSKQKPTFVRHIAPVQTIVELHNSEQDLGEIGIATIQLPGISQLERGTFFAVQSRLIPTDPAAPKRVYSTGQINKMLAEALAEETGAVEAIKKPQVIISILCTSHKAYIGISSAEENLSTWPGGARHYAQTPEQISRAEFKLLEALETFGVILPSQGRALDLGAAPGGWTRLLLEAGLQVVAVDPARLDERLKKRKDLEHYRGYAENFIEEVVQNRSRYDLIVNDMRMDAREAARLLVRAAQCLRPDGFVVSVFKLPHTTEVVNPLTNLKEALSIMRKGYGIVQSRQLFHNRQEVTLIAAQPLSVKNTRSH